MRSAAQAICSLAAWLAPAPLGPGQALSPPRRPDTNGTPYCRRATGGPNRRPGPNQPGTPAPGGRGTDAPRPPPVRTRFNGTTAPDVGFRARRGSGGSPISVVQRRSHSLGAWSLGWAKGSLDLGAAGQRDSGSRGGASSALRRTGSWRWVMCVLITGWAGWPWAGAEGGGLARGYLWMEGETPSREERTRRS